MHNQDLHNNSKLDVEVVVSNITLNKKKKNHLNILYVNSSLHTQCARTWSGAFRQGSGREVAVELCEVKAGYANKLDKVYGSKDNTAFVF